MVSKKSSLKDTLVEEKKNSPEVKAVIKEDSKKKKTIKTESTPKAIKPKAVKEVTKKTENTTNHNYNPIDEVLSIKAKNEEKRDVNASKKVVKTKSKLNSPAEKNEIVNVEKKSKVVLATRKRDEVKENAKKAGEKKFKALKDEQYNNECKSTTAFRAFIDGYKNIFKYNARTSRYEYWSFLLLNLIFANIFSLAIVFCSDILSPISTIVITSIFNLIQIIVYLALVVRRIHDVGEKAWKSFYAPLTYSAIAVLALAFGVSYLSKIVPTMSVSLILVIILMLVALFINLYYLMKIFIVASFVEEEAKENIYGLQKPYDLNKTIRFMCLYFLIAIVIFAVSNALLFNSMVGIRY